MNGRRLQCLSKRVNSPTRAKDLKDPLKAFEQWERELKEFEREAGEVNAVSKLTALRSLLPTELDNEIGRSTTIKTYKEAKAYIYDQIQDNRDATDGRSKDANGWDDYEEPEQDEYDLQAYPCGDDYMNAFGKGGGGKGQFQGFCNFCGKWGHRLNQCFEKDNEMKKGGDKGKGKAYGNKDGGGKANEKGKGFKGGCKGYGVGQGPYGGGGQGQ